ncbi:hypothetical protein AWB78_04706 [Caballeronia calidae]|uniref:Uncharacterized protein n=1 Tax=Caballeronia calidae TaxID=1777139 RepID=A0A158D469_9BURK|nr:hypothetical protein AWB78_04706 [Caballeronia calidae]
MTGASQSLPLDCREVTAGDGSVSVGWLTQAVAILPRNAAKVSNPPAGRR